VRNGGRNSEAGLRLKIPANATRIYCGSRFLAFSHSASQHWELDTRTCFSVLPHGLLTCSEAGFAASIRPRSARRSSVALDSSRSVEFVRVPCLESLAKSVSLFVLPRQLSTSSLACPSSPHPMPCFKVCRLCAEMGWCGSITRLHASSFFGSCSSALHAEAGSQVISLVASR
jgi:hypothetical protein